MKNVQYTMYYTMYMYKVQCQMYSKSKMLSLRCTIEQLRRSKPLFHTHNTYVVHTPKAYIHSIIIYT